MESMEDMSMMVSLPPRHGSSIRMELDVVHVIRYIETNSEFELYRFERRML